MYKRNFRLVLNPLLEFYKQEQFAINKRLNFKRMSSLSSSSPVEIDSIESLEKFPIYEDLKLKFEKAEKNNDLVYNSKSECEYLTDDVSGMKYELKIVDALSLRPINRPTEPGTKEIETKEKIDKVKSKNPFIKPEPELTIVDSLCNDYRVILNKYPNTEEHFLVVTKEFIQQDTLLKPIELQIIYTILKNINSSNTDNDDEEKVKFFAFFNSGPESGYSQFHKHIQFMKLPENFNIYQDDVINGHEHYIPNDLNDSKQPLSEKNFKFRHFILPLPTDFKNNNEFEEILSTMYITLIRRVMNVFKEYEEIDKDFKFTGKISYNFLMTNKWMMIVPRRNAKFNGIWQNSLGYMGLFSVKNDEVKNNLMDTGISNLLENCGFPLQENEEESKIVYNEYSY
ncbi:hypothetical protein BVG19_g887 [[Candida] boidinii]|nr:hypothetical protein BVG19_g887 [[Candida] boidinii]